VFGDGSCSDVVPHDSLYFYKVRIIDFKLGGTVFQPGCEGLFTDWLLISSNRKNHRNTITVVVYQRKHLGLLRETSMISFGAVE